MGIASSEAQESGLGSARMLSLLHIAVSAAAIALLLAGCSHPSESPREEPSGVENATKRERSGPPMVIFEPSGKKRAAVLVEVVRTPEAIQRGLMYRETMDENRGMLFLMPNEEVQSFWMRNTYIPLDMIFIGRDRRVVGVVKNTTPETDDRRSVGKPSIYVVEVNAGWAAAKGIEAGTPARFKNVSE